MDETDPKLLKLFPENLEALCHDLNWYLDSLDDPKSVFRLHPKFNSSLSSLFGDFDLEALQKSDSFQYLVDRPHSPDQTHCQDESRSDDGSSPKLDKESLKRAAKHAKYFEEIHAMCTQRRAELEKEIIDALLSHENELSEFSIDLNHCDSTLGLVEEALRRQYASLEVSCNNIKKLHDESKDISAGLDNRKKLVDRLQQFVKDVIITPVMIKSLCNDPINDSYVLLVQEFSTKSANLDNFYSGKDYPALEFSKIQIKKLELVLIRRIFDFLTVEISNLATPKVNIQMLQTTKFASFHPLYKYLANFPNYTDDLKKLYMYTLRKTYGHLFENYLNALENCFEKERCRDVSCLLRVRSASVVQRQNKRFSYYDLDSRDAILEDFNSQPIIPAGLQGSSLKKEHIVKSYFKLLVDTCATEYQFISSFFFPKEDKGSLDKSKGAEGQAKAKTSDKGERRMLKEVFSEVFDVVSSNLKVYFRTGFDLVALSIIYCVIRFNRKSLIHRGLTFFESEMYELETLASDRINFVLKEIMNLLQKTAKNPQISTILVWNPAPFVINLSHIFRVIIALNQYTNKFNHHASQLLEYLVDLIARCSNKLDPNKNAIFSINNLSFLVDVVNSMEDKSLFSSDTFDLVEKSKSMNESLEVSLEFYANFLLTEFISELINVMEREEEPIDDTTPKKTLTIATQAQEYRTICEDFIANYNERTFLIKNLISQSFMYSSTSALVNSYVFSMFYDIYSKFYENVLDMFRESPSAWLSKMPNPDEFKP